MAIANVMYSWSQKFTSPLHNLLGIRDVHFKQK